MSDDVNVDEAMLDKLVRVRVAQDDEHVLPRDLRRARLFARWCFEEKSPPLEDRVAFEAALARLLCEHRRDSAYERATERMIREARAKAKP